MTPIPADTAFFQSLYQLDHDLFLKLKAKGCPLCGGPLDTSNYPRKPRGLGEEENSTANLSQMAQFLERATRADIPQ